MEPWQWIRIHGAADSREFLHEQEAMQFVSSMRGPFCTAIDVRMRTGQTIRLEGNAVNRAKRGGLREAVTDLLQQRVRKPGQFAAIRASSVRSLEVLGVEAPQRERQRYRVDLVDRGLWEQVRCCLANLEFLRIKQTGPEPSQKY